MITVQDIRDFKLVGTHNGSFHPDEVFAYAFLKLINADLNIVRTRDNEKLKECDFIFDVAIDGIHNPYDHHYENKEYRCEDEYNIPYSSFGLIWRDLGLQYIEEFGLEEDEAYRLFKSIDYRLVRSIDADDNGVDIASDMFDIADVIGSLNPSWDSDISHDVAFNEAVLIAQKILKGLIDKEVSKSSARHIVNEAFAKSQNGIMVLKTYVPWESQLLSLNADEKVKIVVFPGHDGDYKLRVVPKYRKGFETLIDLPAEWAGKRNSELQEITGVDDAIFCHSGRFLAAAETFSGAIKLAKLALKK